MAAVEIAGLDIYDPIKDEVKPRSVHDIAYWMVDDDYDGSNFVVRQVFFCGGDKDEFDKWKKRPFRPRQGQDEEESGKTLKIELDDEAFDRLYGFVSHPIAFQVRQAGGGPRGQPVRRGIDEGAAFVGHGEACQKPRRL